jgi:molybdopterin-guanine dinucleotide biosynthesis protein A
MAAVVLTGGQSRRMGRDKATMAHPGQPGLTMVEHTVGVLAQRCTPVFVVAAPGQRLPALGARVLRDEVRGAGPLRATGRGLRAAAEEGLERAFVCAVDMPYLSVDIIDILDGYQGIDVVLPWDGRDHYLAGIYRTDLADRIDALVATGRNSMWALAQTVRAERVAVPPTGALTNLNSESDLG